MAADQAGVDAVPEVRRMQAWHDCSILHGNVTVEDVFRACQEKSYDVLHFATEGGPIGMRLSDGALMSPEDISQALRLRETRGVFFNSYRTGRLASYCVRHGATWAISSEINPAAGEAWKLAAAFYSHQRNGQAKDFVGAYVLADSGDGEYALHIAPEYVQDLQRTAALAASIPHTALPLTRREALLWGLGLLGASAALTAALHTWAGRF